MSTDMTELYDMTFDDVEDDFDLPNNEYLFEVRRSAVKWTDEEKPRGFVELSLKPVEVLSENEAVGDLANAWPVKDKLWVHTKGAKKYSIAAFSRILGENAKGMKLSTIAEAMIGRQVRAITKMSHKEGNTYVNVDRYLGAVQA